MKIKYPNGLKNAEPIIGFVSKELNRVDITPGETKELDDNTGSQLLSTFTFLEEVNEIKMETEEKKDPDVSDLVNPPVEDIKQAETDLVSDDKQESVEEMLKNIPFSDKRALIKAKGISIKQLSIEKADQIIIDNNLLI